LNLGSILGGSRGSSRALQSGQGMPGVPHCRHVAKRSGHNVGGEVQLAPKSMLCPSAVATVITGMLSLSANSQTEDRVRDPAGARGEAREECKPKLYSTAGRVKFKEFTLAREMRGEGAAMANAIANWQRNVSDQYGSEWMLWERAEDKSFTCGPSRSGTILCVVEARPCGGGPERPPDEEPEQAGRSRDKYSRSRVLEAQQRMNGCNTCGRQIKVDGQCGPQTERRLRTFQVSPSVAVKAWNSALPPTGRPSSRCASFAVSNRDTRTMSNCSSLPIKGVPEGGSNWSPIDEAATKFPNSTAICPLTWNMATQA
jgi:hypothetical protein